MVRYIETPATLSVKDGKNIALLSNIKHLYVTYY